MTRDLTQKYKLFAVAVVAFNLILILYLLRKEKFFSLEISYKIKKLEFTTTSPTTASTTKFTNFEEKERKTILIWTIPFGDISMCMEYVFEKVNYSTDRDELRKNGFTIQSTLCGNCKFTFDRRLQTTADAILFHAIDVNEAYQPNMFLRKPNQLYVYWTMETLRVNRLMQPRFLKKFNTSEFYNATMTFRFDSDIYSPYASLAWILKLLWYKNNGTDLLKKFATMTTKSLTTKKELETYQNKLPASSLTSKYEEKPLEISPIVWKIMAKKDRLATWIVSNCGKFKGNDIDRRKYMNFLIKAGLKVDVFGKCGIPFPVKSRWDPAFHEIVGRYKFYFAFENSLHCKGYISEKVWYNALYSGTVPVIFGPHRDDIRTVLPPKSYIFVEDFSSYHDLLKYLQDLDRNATAYAQYLEWRTWLSYLNSKGEFHFENFKNVENLSQEKLALLQKYATTTPLSFCALCKHLYQTHPYQKNRTLSQWIANDRSACNDAAVARNMFWSSQKSSFYH